MRSRGFRIVHSLLKGFGWLLLVVVLLLVLLNLPAVQTGLAGVFTRKLSKQTNTRIEVGRVHVNFVDRVDLREIYVEDLSGDTLLYAGRLKVNIAIAQLLKRKLSVDEILLDNTTVHLVESDSGAFNFQFLLDRFATSDTIPKTNAKPFDVFVKKVNLSNVYATTDLKKGANRAHIGELTIKMNSMDLSQGLFDIKQIEIAQLHGRSVWDARIPKAKNKVKKKPIKGFPLRKLPLDLKCEQLSIIDSRVFYERGESAEQDRFDARFLHGENLNLDIRDIKMDSTLVAASIRNISLDVNEKAHLRSFAVDASYGARGSSVEALQFEFNDTEAKLSASTEYDNFGDLVALSEKVGAGLVVDDLSVDPSDLLYFLPFIGRTPELKPLLGQTLELKTDLSGNLSEVNIAALQIRSGANNLSLGGTFSGLPQMDRLAVKKGSLDLQTSMAELALLLGEKIIPPSYKRFGKIHTVSAFNGSMDDLNISSLQIATQSLLRMDLSGNVGHLLETDDMTFDLNIHEIRSGYADALAFTDSLPDMLKQLDTIRYRGTARGDLRKMALKGSFTTSVGKVGTDLALDFNKQYSNARYKGDIEIQELQIGRLLGIDSLGTLTMSTTVDGSGLSLDSLNTTMNTYVQSLDYKGYLYEQFALDGAFERRQFTGDFIMRDEHISVDFSGRIDFNDSIPIVQCNALIDELDLYALNLMPAPFNIHGAIEADLSGLRPDDMEGSLSLTDIALNREDILWVADTVSFIASRSDLGLRDIRFRSPIALGSIKGNYTFANLTGLLAGFANEYFDMNTLSADSLRTLQPSRERFAREHVEISLDMRDLAPLAEIMGIGLTKLDTAHLYFLLDNPNDLLKLSLEVPALHYGTTSVDSLVLHADNDGGVLNTNLKTGKIFIANGVSLPGITLQAHASENEASLQMIVLSVADTGLQRLELNTRFEAQPGSIRMYPELPLVLNGKYWDIHSEDPYVFYKDHAELPDLTIQSGQEAIRAGGGDGIIGVDVLNFDLVNLTDLVDFGNLVIGGTMFGHLDIGLTPDKPLVQGDLDVLSINANGIQIGDISIWAGARGKQAWGTINFSGFNNEVIVEALYDLGSRKLDGELILEQLNVTSIQPFLKEYADQASGFLSGNIRIHGTLEDPEFEGNVKFSDVSAFIIPAQTVYSIGSGEISLTNQLITPNMTFLDEEGRKATLKGKVSHRNFNDMAFDLKFNTDEFTFLNSQKRDEDLYYGKFVGKLNAAITGDPQLPKVVASLTTMDGSDVTVQLLSKKAVLGEQAYILFYDGRNNYSEDQLDSLAISRYKVRAGIDLTLNAAIRNNTAVRLVIDPITGDNLELTGRADLLVRIPKNGDLSITGTYTVEEGNYRFSYQSLLKRNFGIVKGSRILFTGNILDALLDIKARYTTKASTYSLVAGDIGTLSESDIRTLRRKSEVSVLLNIGGKLSAPELVFDIQLDEENQGPVGSSVERALASLRQNESELNKQVFGLLLFNSFTGISATGSASTTGSGTAMRSVGNLINTQLNKLAQKADGLEIDFDLDQYAGALSESKAGITEIDLGISQTLAKDKLVISVSSNIGLEGGNSSGKAMSNVAGDFILEYKITQGGKYRVKVFQKADYDAFSEDNVWKTGVGFSYQTSFGRQFFKNQRKNEKK